MTVQSFNIAARYNVHYNTKILFEVKTKLGKLVKTRCLAQNNSFFTESESFGLERTLNITKFNN